VAEHVVDRELLGTAVQADTAVRRAVGATDQVVVLLQDGDLGGRRFLPGGEQVLVHVLELEERDHGAGDVGVREHPLERRLRIGARLLAEAGQPVVLGALQRLHRDHAHVLLAARVVHDLADRRPQPVMVREHHHVEAADAIPVFATSTRFVCVEEAQEAHRPAPV
jgi:hypothetical protein